MKSYLFFFYSLVLLTLISQISLANEYCKIEASEVREKQNNPESLFRLAVSEGCTINSIGMPSYFGERTTQMVTFISYTEWRGGIGSSKIGICIDQTWLIQNRYSCFLP